MTTQDYFAKLCDSAASRIAFGFNDQTTLETIREIVVGLPKGWQFLFFDRDYPSGSDPGAWVEVERIGQRFRYRRGNHGWTGKWEFHTPDEVADYAFQCRCHRHLYCPIDFEPQLCRK
jgi:hypothetical protein